MRLWDAGRMGTGAVEDAAEAATDMFGGGASNGWRGVVDGFGQVGGSGLGGAST